jgi:zinc protease
MCGQSSSEIAGDFEITVTAKPGKSLAEMDAAVSEEIARLLKDGVTQREIQTALNNVESRLINRVASSLGQASALATAFTLTGDAGNVNRELKRYEGITPAEVMKQATAVLTSHKVVLSIVPEGKTNLSAESKPAGKEMPK